MLNQVNKSLAAVLESKRKITNSLHLKVTNSITAPTSIQKGRTQVTTLQEYGEQGMRSALPLTQGGGCPCLP